MDGGAVALVSKLSRMERERGVRSRYEGHPWARSRYDPGPVFCFLICEGLGLGLVSYI